MRLTPARLSVLRSIRDWTDAHGYPPTVRDLCAVTGYSSTCTVAAHIRALVAGGWLVSEPLIARSLRLTELGVDALEQRSEDQDARPERVERATRRQVLRRKNLAKAGAR